MVSKKYIAFAFVCISSVTLCMKRSAGQFSEKTLHERKKQKITKNFQPLHNFFSFTSQLTRYCKRYCSDPSMHNETKKLIAELPREIKNKITCYRNCPLNDTWWDLAHTIRYDSKIFSLAFHPDNRLAIGRKNNIEIIETQTYTQLSSIPLDNEMVANACAYSKDGIHFSYSVPGNVIVRNEHNKTQKEYPQHTSDIIWSIAFDNKAKHIAIVKSNNDTDAYCIQKVNLTTKKVSYNVDTEMVYGLFFNEKNMLTYGTCDNTICTIKNKKKKETPLITIYNNFNKCLWALSSNNEFLALGYKNGQVALIHVPSQTNNLMFSAHDAVYSLALNNAANQLAIGLEDGTMMILQKYTAQTFEQILLRRILFLWLQTEKPDRLIQEPEKLLNCVAKQFHLQKEELHLAWSTFPTSIQKCFWYNISRLIQKYGKF